MNSKNYNILIVETSCIIYNGLFEILSKKFKNFHFSRCFELTELDKNNLINNIDIVIINFSAVCNQNKLFRNIKKENDKVKWIAFINSVYDVKDLELFDSFILISDIEEKIVNTVNKTIEQTNLSNQVSESKQDNLSVREIEVLRLLVAGFSAKEIAEKLFLSIHTVVTHKKNISQKTGIKSVAGLTVFAILNNIVDPEKYG